MGMQPILPITVSVRKIKGAARQHYVDFNLDVTVSLDVNKSLLGTNTTLTKTFLSTDSLSVLPRSDQDKIPHVLNFFPMYFCH